MYLLGFLYEYCLTKSLSSDFGDTLTFLQFSVIILISYLDVIHDHIPFELKTTFINTHDYY